jgi:hypothetical protein
MSDRVALSKDGLSALRRVSSGYEHHLFIRQMSDRLQELSIFARVAESRSFSRAARELGLSNLRSHAL